MVKKKIQEILEKIWFRIFFSCLKCTNIKIDYTHRPRKISGPKREEMTQGWREGICRQGFGGEKVGKAQLARP